MAQALSPVRLSLAAFRAAYPNATITDQTIEVYEAALADLDPIDISDAVSALIKECRYMPTIAEIREVVAEQRLDLPTPSEAWGEAQGRAFGDWEGARHPLVYKAMQLMGGAYSIKTSENPSIMQAQFLKHYRELRAELMQRFIRTGEAPEPEQPTARLILVETDDGFEQIEAPHEDVA